jgi:hypothetical protein
MNKSATLKQLDRITGRVEWIENELSAEKYRRAKELLGKAKTALIDAIREIEQS